MIFVELLGRHWMNRISVLVGSAAALAEPNYNLLANLALNVISQCEPSVIFRLESKMSALDR